MDSRTGDLRTSRSLDREEHGAHFTIQILVISAGDSGGPLTAARSGDGRAAAAGTRVSECSVQLTVEDVNDSPPYFEDLSSIRFSENTLPGEIITAIKVIKAIRPNERARQYLGTGSAAHSAGRGESAVFFVHLGQRNYPRKLISCTTCVGFF